jgi:hypothetical protein
MVDIFNMSERQNTIVFALYATRPRISAYEFHEWIYAQMFLEDQAILMMQIDRPKRHVYIQFRDSERMPEVLQLTGGEAEYKHKHTNGEI